MADKKSHYDVLLLGGGLANGLLALFLTKRQPRLKIALVERSSHLGGNHTWCFHQPELNDQELELVRPLISHSWDTQSVRFKKYNRTLKMPYYCVSSELFDHHLLTLASENPNFVIELNSTGENVSGTVTIDGRGLSDQKIDLQPGFQKFLGLELELEQPHNIESPIIMDATVAQRDGYRFMYVLPLTTTKVLVEDTYYSNDPDLNEEVLTHAILDYAERLDLKVKDITRVERGCLPIPIKSLKLKSQGDFASGLLGGYFHPTTGYSFSQAVRFANWLSKQDLSDKRNLLENVARYRLQQKRKASYFYFLNKMMFMCTPPTTRFRILENFYKMPEGLISRFYGFNFTAKDKIHLLLGRPPFGPNMFWIKNTWNAISGQPHSKPGSVNENYIS